MHIFRSIHHGQRSYVNTQGDSLNYSVDKNTILSSYPLADYIDIGIFSDREIDGKKQEIEVYLHKHLITDIHNKISIIGFFQCGFPYCYTFKRWYPAISFTIKKE